MTRTLYFITTTLFWIIMMGLLIHKEYFGLARVNSPHELLTIETSASRGGYMAYYLDQARIGFGQTILVSNEYEYIEGHLKEEAKETDSPYTLKHSSFLTFLLLGHQSEMFAKGKAHLDRDLNLESFSLRVKNKEEFTDISGEVRDKEIVVLIKNEGHETTQQVVPINGPVLHSETLSFLWTPQNLKMGKRGRFQVWNPLSLSIEEIKFFVSHKEVIPYQEDKRETSVIMIEKGATVSRLWVTTEGEVIQMESPMGLLLKKEPGWQIFDGLREASKEKPDLPNLYSIETDKNIGNPELLNFLKIKLIMPDGERIADFNKANIQNYTGLPFPISNIDKTIQPFLEPTEFVQSRDPAIVQKAQEIIAGETDALRAISLLVSWVNRNVTPLPTSSVPSAVQVLKTKEGDCNEYTTLFTALARAAGIPTKMIAGLVYQQGRFFYHAWPVVFLGKQWLAIDPTFGQVPADVAHIPLVEGGVKEQLSILNILGNMQISILDFQ